MADTVEEVSLPEVGGPKPATDRLIPYEGGTVRMSPEAQHSSKASQEFVKAFPEYDAPTRSGGVITNTVMPKGRNNLDPESQQNLDELRAMMRQSPPKPATIINLHPWPLSFGYTDRILRGIVVPPCEPSMPYSWFHVRGYRLDWKENSEGGRIFSAITPIRIAGEFAREFGNEYSLQGEMNTSGGVIIYQGEGCPDKVVEVETYDQMGRPHTTIVNGYDEDPDGTKFPVKVATPIMARLDEVLKKSRKLRNDMYLQFVRAADRDYKLPDGRGRKLITPRHQLMAEVLFAEGVIKEMPNWNLPTSLEQGMSDNNCPACGSMFKEGAFKCMACNHILNALEAYKHLHIKWDDPSMEMLTSDEYAEALEIKAERDKVRVARKAAELKAKEDAKAKKAEAGS